MIISEQEHITLIKLATEGRFVQTKFGPGWVALDGAPDDWAHKAVELMLSQSGID